MPRRRIRKSHFWGNIARTAIKSPLTPTSNFRFPFINESGRICAILSGNRSFTRKAFSHKNVNTSCSKETAATVLDLFLLWPSSKYTLYYKNKFYKIDIEAEIFEILTTFLEITEAAILKRLIYFLCVDNL